MQHISYNVVPDVNDDPASPYPACDRLGTFVQYLPTAEFARDIARALSLHVASHVFAIREGMNADGTDAYAIAGIFRAGAEVTEDAYSDYCDARETDSDGDGEDDGTDVRPVPPYRVAIDDMDVFPASPVGTVADDLPTLDAASRVARDASRTSGTFVHVLASDGTHVAAFFASRAVPLSLYRDFAAWEATHDDDDDSDA